MNEPPQAEALSDEQLACRAQQGCVASFEQLARRFQVRLVRFLCLWGSLEDAEDLSQETLVRAYQNLHRYRPQWRFCTWLFTIARRLSMNQQRRKRPAGDADALEGVASGGAGPAEAVAREESRRRFWDLAEAVLTGQQMTAVWMFYVEEMPIKEMARALDCSRVSLRAMLFRARKRLLQVLSESEDCQLAAGDGDGRSSRCPSVAEVFHG